MPETIRRAVGIQRELMDGDEMPDEIHQAVRRYANAMMYKDLARINALAQDIATLMARKWYKAAREIGEASAGPILEGMGLADKGSVLRGEQLAKFRAYEHANTAVFRAGLKAEGVQFSAQAEAAFLRAQRDGVAKKRLIEQLVAADKGELDRLITVRGEIKDASAALAKAELTGNAKAIRAAKKALTKARAKIGTAKTFLARFETAVQAQARDTIRRNMQQAGFRALKQANPGVLNWTWVAVNGADACPSCEDRHGESRTEAEWRGDGPGDGGTYCGTACMCQIVPESYAASNRGLKEPVKLGPRNTPRPDVPKGSGPTTTVDAIQLGGKLARQAREVAKRAKVGYNAKMATDATKLPLAKAEQVVDGEIRRLLDAAKQAKAQARSAKQPSVLQLMDEARDARSRLDRVAAQLQREGVSAAQLETHPQYKAVFADWQGKQARSALAFKTKLTAQTTTATQARRAALTALSEPQPQVIRLAPPDPKLGAATRERVLDGIADVRGLMNVRDLRAGPLGIKATSLPSPYNLRGNIYFPESSGALNGAHEFGHWLDDASPHIRARVREWYAKRTAGKPLLDLSGPNAGKPHVGAVKSTDVVYRDGGFFAPYVGKDYSHYTDARKGASEVFSMGVEELREDPIGFATKDYDHFRLIVGLLKGLL